MRDRFLRQAPLVHREHLHDALQVPDEALALRQTRDSLIRASLVRHAALPGGALLAMLVAPKLLPFV